MADTDDTVRLARPDLTREMLIAELKALRPALERERLSHLALFGWRARGDNRPDSDIDLPIDVFPGRKFSGFDVAGVGLSVEDILKLSTSILMRGSIRDNLRPAIQADAVQMF
jgi:predicted nucleotidyltransferase